MSAADQVAAWNWVDRLQIGGYNRRSPTGKSPTKRGHTTLEVEKVDTIQGERPLAGYTQAKAKKVPKMNANPVMAVCAITSRASIAWTGGVHTEKCGPRHMECMPRFEV